MSLMKRFGLIAGAAVSLSSVAMAQSTDQSRAYANELISDSSVRTSLLAPAAAFAPKLGGYEQFRYVLNSRSDSGLDANNNKTTLGFQNARTRVNLGGNIFSEDWGYFIQFGWGDATSGSLLEDAYGTYKLGNGWDLKVGQFKLPFSKEQLVGDTTQLAIDRSVTDSFFYGGNGAGGRSQGVQGAYSADAFRIMIAFSDGINSGNTDFTSGAEADFGFTGRGEFKWAGDWAQADEFTGFQNSKFFGMAGVAAHYESGGSTVNTTDQTLFGLTGDVMVKGSGWNAFAQATYVHLDPNGGQATDDFGVVLQGGIFVAAQWELFGRLDFIVFDSTRSPNDDTFSTLTAGANYYISPDSHAVKLTAELEYFLTKFSNSSAPASTMTGLLPSAKSSQFMVAGQLQLVF